MGLSVGMRPRDALTAAAAALVGAAAFPPLGIWPLALVAPLLFLRLLRDKTPADARQLGLVYGVVYAGGTMYWFFGIFGLTAVSLLAIMAAYFGILATLVGATRGRPPFVRAALVALFAVAIEWLRGDAWYLRFPWYTAPHALAQQPACVAPVRWVGVYGLSFVIWFVAAVGVFTRPYAWLAFVLLPATALVLGPAEAPDRYPLLMQFEDSSHFEKLLHDAPTGALDLAVLPEYAFPYGLDRALKSPHGPTALAKKLGCPVVFGSVEGEYGAKGFQNVAAVIDAEGRLLGTFPKQRPVPMMLDGLPGTRRPVFPVDGGTLGVGICYDFDAPEIAASLVRQGATVLLAPTGDLMPWGHVQHVHHELLLRLRAVENDRWVLRATSSGRTEVIDPQGRPYGDGLEIGTTGQLVGAFSHRSTTPFGGQACLLGPLAAALSAVYLLSKAAAAWRNRSKLAAVAAVPTDQP